MEALPENEVARFLILAGPAGSGKTTLCDRLVDENDHLERVVTCTTRAPRVGEIDKVDYYFLSDEQFDAKVESGEFLEWAHVHTYRYGTLKSTIEAKLEDDVANSCVWSPQQCKTHIAALRNSTNIYNNT